MNPPFDLNFLLLSNPSQYCGFVLMFIIGVLVSDYPISYITSALHLLQNKEFEPYSITKNTFNWRITRHQSSILGVVERVLFISALLINIPEFIVFWYTIKMISLWNRWSEKGGRDLFNTFLIGNGLSLLFSISAFMIFKSSFTHDINYRILLMIFFTFSPFLFAFILIIWIHCFYKKYKEGKGDRFQKCFDKLFEPKKTKNDSDNKKNRKTDGS